MTDLHSGKENLCVLLLFCKKWGRVVLCCKLHGLPLLPAILGSRPICASLDSIRTKSTAGNFVTKAARNHEQNIRAASDVAGKFKGGDMLIHSINIGTLNLNGNVFLAPVAGWSDCVFRYICTLMGASFSYTEMVSAEAVVRGNTKTQGLFKRLPSAVSNLQTGGGDTLPNGEKIVAAINGLSRAISSKGGGNTGTPTLKDKLWVALLEVNLLAHEIGEKQAALVMRKRFSSYIKGVAGGAKLRAMAVASSTIHDYENILDAAGVPLPQNVAPSPDNSSNSSPTAAGQYPYAIQLFGSEPATIGKAASIVYDATHCNLIDINCGCPVKKILKEGAGSSLLSSPQKIAAIVQTVKQSVPVPVSIKIRLGLDSAHETFLEVADFAIKAGVDAITLHPRTALQGYSGTADWAKLARLTDFVAKRTLVFGSGDVFSANDISKMISKTGVDGVMVARGAMGYPFIFHEATML